MTSLANRAGRPLDIQSRLSVEGGCISGARNRTKRIAAAVRLWRSRTRQTTCSIISLNAPDKTGSRAIDRERCEKKEGRSISRSRCSQRSRFPRQWHRCSVSCRVVPINFPTEKHVSTQCTQVKGRRGKGDRGTAIARSRSEDATTAVARVTSSDQAARAHGSAVSRGVHATFECVTARVASSLPLLCTLREDLACYERMSCSVKISCGKGWSGSQRRINSLAEETTCSTSGNASCAGLAAQPATVASTSTSTTATTSTATTTNTVTRRRREPEDRAAPSHQVYRRQERGGYHETAQVHRR